MKTISKKNKKAQLQIMENVFVLIIIFIILIIAFVFAIGMQRSAQKDKLDELREIELIKKSQILNFFPELQCSDNNNLEPDCYDIYKIMSFKEKMEEDDAFLRYYKFLFGNIKITIHRYDPSPNTQNWFDPVLLFDNPKSEDLGIKIVRFPILLRNVIEEKDYFGVIEVGVYE
ncbi:hypothetical protein JXC34_01960 [Candidatus Woesearchaeota archaeon]|nr:hypothetical protein [Candidatus Woesearchaeota archaeon]